MEPLLTGRRAQRGAATVLVVAILVTLMVMVALSVDVGHMLVVRTHLQGAADAAALAAAARLPDPTDSVSEAVAYTTHNDRGHPGILDPGDVVLGHWDLASRTFSAGANPVNSVRVALERSPGRGNALPLSFARLLGRHAASARAVAIAYSASGPGTRFLIDEEVIDSDVPSIEELADRLGRPPDEIIRDNDGDWFIDLPPGEVLTLPTGQVGDEGLFDVSHAAFPFGDSTSPSYEDFLNFNEDGTWRQDLVPKSMLDPLLGPEPVNDPADYPGFVDEDFCNVSPVWKSDLSVLNPVGGDPAVNALGERRGLLSFQLIGIGSDPDGAGSKLPDIIIRICAPGEIGEVDPPTSSSLRIVLVH